jgi:hypothetical protein
MRFNVTPKGPQAWRPLMPPGSPHACGVQAATDAAEAALRSAASRPGRLRVHGVLYGVIGSPVLNPDGAHPVAGRLGRASRRPRTRTLNRCRLERVK